MTKINIAWKILTIGCALGGMHGASQAVDSVSFEFGSGNQTDMIRVGSQWKWNSQWWRSNGTHIGGYWDLNLSQWRGKRFQNASDKTQNITAIGITPVFRFQNDSLKGFYIEAGIGAYLLSELYNNNAKKLSTGFQFGDHLGIGYVFQSNLDLGLSLQHFSNAGIKEPNNGVNFTIARISYSF
jgi:lipid A 3-O-deacylase